MTAKKTKGSYLYKGNQLVSDIMSSRGIVLIHRSGARECDALLSGLESALHGYKMG